MKYIEPLFSVLIANYNNGRYLQEAIDSVLEQTYQNWEIVLVDDGSTDNSFEIYKKYESDKRFKIYYNEVNSGCGFTKRRCIELANGEICGFLDSDDILKKDALNIMFNLHVENPQCSLIYSKLNNYINNETVVDEQVEGYSKDSEDLVLAKQWSVTHFATFKMKSYINTSGINPNLKLAVDTDLYYLLEEVGEVLGCPEILYLYRKDNCNSICQGSDGVKAYFYRSIVAMNAIIRRKKNNSDMWFINKLSYISVYRYWLTYYMKYSSKKLLFNNYTLHYLIINSFSVSSFKHVLKMTRMYSYLKIT